MPLGEWGISPTTCSRQKEPKIKATRRMLKGNAVASLWLFPLHFSSLKPLGSPAVKLFNIFLASYLSSNVNSSGKPFLTSRKFDPWPTPTCALLPLCTFPSRHLSQCVTVHLFCDLKKKTHQYLLSLLDERFLRMGHVHH